MVRVSICRGCYFIAQMQKNIDYSLHRKDMDLRVRSEAAESFCSMHTFYLWLLLPTQFVFSHYNIFQTVLACFYYWNKTNMVNSMYIIASSLLLLSLITDLTNFRYITRNKNMNIKKNCNRVIPGKKRDLSWFHIL